MSAATNTLEAGVLLLLLNNVDFTGIGDAGGLQGSAAAGDVFVSLHTADPGEEGNQSSSETNYSGYARVPVSRTAAGWTVDTSAGTFENTGAVQFPAATGGSSTVTHLGIGTAASGSGKLLWKGGFSNPASLAISAGIAPKFDAGVINGSVN